MSERHLRIVKPDLLTKLKREADEEGKRWPMTLPTYLPFDHCGSCTTPGRCTFARACLGGAA